MHITCREISASAAMVLKNSVFVTLRYPNTTSTPSALHEVDLVDLLKNDKMVYNWENYETICYQMYIEDKKSLEEIMEYMKLHHKFSPRSVIESHDNLDAIRLRRGAQYLAVPHYHSHTLVDFVIAREHFRHNSNDGYVKNAIAKCPKILPLTELSQDFPSKQNPAHKNLDLVQRVKELWERNTSQKEMLRILNEEDHFDIKERELMRVRAKNRWLLRTPNGMKSTSTKRQQDSEQDVMNQLQQALYEDGQQGEEHGSVAKLAEREESPELSPVVLAKRQERLEKLQAESAERWATRKRRRRTRGWAGLPADPPGPPRFPSETTIDESKAFLSLDSTLYRDIRARFQRICEEDGVIKKTLAGPERWEAVKARLVQESPHLQSVFWGNDENQEAKKLALDVVCTDVTKRMRTLERRMTIAEAKNALGVNPEQSRQIRNAFYQTLKDDHFTSKLEAGDTHWKELKAQWIEGSDLLKGILAPGDADPNHQEKVKAMEVLCRDVMKRLRDDQTKRDPTRKKKFDTNYTASAAQALGQFNDAQHELDDFQIGPHDALVQAAAHAQAQAQAHAHNQVNNGQTHTHGQEGPGQVQPQGQNQSHGIGSHGNMQIDPSLLLAAANDPSLIHANAHNQFSAQQYADQQYVAQAGQAVFPPSRTSIAVYFRIHPSSDIQTSIKIWVAALTSVSVDELRQLVTSKFPGTIPMRFEGIIKEVNGNEMNIQIDDDQELDAYLATINGVKPIFAVQLMQGWKND